MTITIFSIRLITKSTQTHIRRIDGKRFGIKDIHTRSTDVGRSIFHLTIEMTIVDIRTATMITEDEFE